LRLHAKQLSPGRAHENSGSGRPRGRGRFGRRCIRIGTPEEEPAVEVDRDHPSFFVAVQELKLKDDAVAARVTVLFNRRQLERTLRIYVRHYNEQRPHRALGLQAPDPTAILSMRTEPTSGAIAIRRRDLLGGLIHEYEAASGVRPS
jgi:transposase InsO family protein